MSILGVKMHGVAMKLELLSKLQVWWHVEHYKHIKHGISLILVAVLQHRVDARLQPVLQTCVFEGLLSFRDSAAHLQASKL